MYNTILIRRRTSGNAGAPASLSGGELAFNEVDSTLYYGANDGIRAIAGAGAYVDRTTNQTVSGDKTFIGLTTLSSTTFSPNSVINAGGNILTNLAEPLSSADAATRNYVDVAINNLANSGGSATTSLSTEIYNTFVKLVDNRAVDLGGGLTLAGGLTADTAQITGSATIDSLTVSNNASVNGNLTVTGDLQVLGSTTTLETTTTLTSAFSVTNAGSQTALTVEQTGPQDIAEFIDDGATALIIKNGGNVGVGISTPNEKLTVSGNISASGTIYAANGLEIGSGNATLFVGNGVVGVNTDTPNEEFTVVGSISATQDIFAVNGNLAGNLNVDGTAAINAAVTLNSTLDVTSAATFASSVSAQGALTVDGTTTLNGSVTVDDTLNVTGATTLGSTLSAVGAATFDSTLTVTGISTLNDDLAINADTTTTGNITGSAGVSLLVDFIIDGGTF